MGGQEGSLAGVHGLVEAVARVLVLVIRRLALWYVSKKYQVKHAVMCSPNAARIEEMSGCCAIVGGRH